MATADDIGSLDYILQSCINKGMNSEKHHLLCTVTSIIFIITGLTIYHSLFDAGKFDWVEVS